MHGALAYAAPYGMFLDIDIVAAFYNAPLLVRRQTLLAIAAATAFVARQLMIPAALLRQ